MGRRETGSLLNIQRIHVYLICRSTPIVTCILHDQNRPKKKTTIFFWAIRYIGHRLSAQLIIFAFLLHMKNGIFRKDILVDPKCVNYITQTDALHDCKAGHNYVPHIQIHNEPEERHDSWAVIYSSARGNKASTYSRHRLWNMIGLSWAESGLRLWLECVERKWVEKHTWEVAGSAPLPLGWATWLWLKNGPLILIPSVLYLQQWVFYTIHMSHSNSRHWNCRARERDNRDDTTILIILKSSIKLINHVARSSINCTQLDISS